MFNLNGVVIFFSFNLLLELTDLYLFFLYLISIHVVFLVYFLSFVFCLMSIVTDLGFFCFIDLGLVFLIHVCFFYSFWVWFCYLLIYFFLLFTNLFLFVIY